MAGRVSRMSWRTFGKRLRKKVIPICVEAALHSGRVENIVINTAIERSSVAGQDLGREVSLIEHVHMGICAESAAIVKVTSLGIQLVS